MEWSTDVLPPSERFGHWREVVCQTFFRLTPEQSDTDRPFRAAVRSQMMGSAALTHIVSTGQIVDRREADIAQDPTTSVCLNIQVAGRGHVTQQGHSALLRAGEACLVTTSEPFRLEFDQDFHQLAVHLPQLLLEPYLPCGEVLARSLPVSPTTSLAIEYARAGEGLPATSAAADRLARHLCEVIGLALAEQLDDRSPAHPSVLAAAIDEIRTSLADPDLSPKAVAERLAISVRTLHGAFRHHDTTFSQEVLRQRLALARQFLLDPGRRGLRVVDIAAEAGFADRSHFHRAFRAATGLTPTTYRTMYGHKPTFR